MSWETSLFTHIDYNRKTYNSHSEVLDDLESCEREIRYFKDQLQTLVACTEPRKIMEEDADPLTWMSTTFRSIMDDLEECYYEKFKLELLSNNWDKCHNEKGLAISPPDDVHWDSSFLDGDFVNTDKHPKANEL